MAWRRGVVRGDDELLRTVGPGLAPAPGTEERSAVSSLVGLSPVNADGGGVELPATRW
jgi:hypothetical protein